MCFQDLFNMQSLQSFLRTDSRSDLGPLWPQMSDMFPRLSISLSLFPNGHSRRVISPWEVALLCYLLKHPRTLHHTPSPASPSFTSLFLSPSFVLLFCRTSDIKFIILL